MINHHSQGQGRLQTAKQSENRVEDQSQLPTPAAIEMTAGPLARLKIHMCTSIAEALPRIWRRKQQQAEMHVARHQQKIVAQSDRAGSAVSQDTGGWLRSFQLQSAARRLLQMIGRFRRVLRRPRSVADYPTTSVPDGPNRYTCPNPSVSAPCEACPSIGCVRNGFRFRSVSKPTPQADAAHRLSETPE